MAKMTIFEVGYCTHPACVALKGESFKACQFPARAYLIEVQEHKWLFDTGYASHFNDATKKGIYSIYRKVTPVYFDQKDAIIHQLKDIGLDESDLDALILSHFHGDHIAGLKDFKNINLICSGEGWQKTRHLTGIRALKQGFLPPLLPADFETRLNFIESFESKSLPPELAPFETAYLLPNSNGEIFIIDLPGHADGHIGLFILTDEGWVLLASDSAWSAKSFKEMRGPSTIAHLIMANSQAYYQTLEKLQQLDQANIAIRLNHEGFL